MLRLALRGLFARKLRTALTALAVVLGVAFVAGTFVFTDTIDASFKDLFQRASKGVDVSVKARQAVDDDFNELQPFDAPVLDRVRAVDGVAAAEGSVEATATLFDRDGEAIGAQAGPALLFSSRSGRFDPLEYEDGGPPASAGEVVIDLATAERNDFAVGDRVRLASRAPAKVYEISGLATLGDTKSLGGASFADLTLAEAQRVSNREGKLDEVVVAADAGVSPQALKRRVAAVAGPAFQVRTGQEDADQQAADIGEQLGFITTALLVFAGVAVLVGGFLIFNTFSITVAQRSREFALLRTLGASRRQVLGAVLLEAALIGLVASVLGVLAGVVLARGLAALLAGFGLDLPTTETVIAPGTVIAGLVVGMLATIASGVIPARRATQVEPVAAMRETDVAGAGRVGAVRIVASAVIAALGVGAMLLGLFGALGSSSADLSALGLGAMACVFGIALFAPVLVRPLARVIGAPLERLSGLTGRLARENAQRQPQRTAVTAAALMVGLALVVFVAIFAAGIRASVDQVIDEQFSASLVVTSQDGFTPIPAGAADRLRGLQGVDAVSAIRFQSGKVAGVPGTTGTSGLDPATVGKVFRPEFVKGSAATLKDLTGRQALADDGWAKENGFGVGETLRVTTPTGKRVGYVLAGTYDNQVGVLGDMTIANVSMTDDWNVEADALVLVGGAEGTTPPQLERAAQAALAPFPSAEPLTLEGFKDQQAEAVNQILGLIYALLSLSVIVSLLGIVNTLALAIYERTRELGLLRAVGMSRRQVRRMVRGEAVITALIGAALGLLLGTAFAALVSRPLAEDGFRLAIPWGTLVGLAVLAALAGVLASLGPARRASRVDVLRAVTTE